MSFHAHNQDICIQKFIKTFKYRYKRKSITQSLTPRKSKPLPSLLSPSLSIGQEFVHAIGNTYWTEAWPALVASRMGHRRSINFAARAVILAQEYTSGSPHTSKSKCYFTEMLAIDAVREDIEAGDCSDETLMAVSLLFLFELFMEPFSTAMYAHLCGRHAVIRARSPDSEAGEVTQAIVYTHWYVPSFSNFRLEEQ